MSGALDPERRSRLLAAKARAVAADLGLDGEASAFPGGAGVVADDRAVVLRQDQPERALGPALAWARQAGASALDLVVEDAAGRLARQAAEFAVPVAVHWLRGRELHRVGPEPLVPVGPPSTDAVDLAPVLAAAGADVVVEHGVVTGEVLGLEIARVVEGELGTRLEAGVGRHDREAFAMLHGDLPPAAALAAVVGAVRSARALEAGDHPLRRLVPERWLREVVLARPSLVGAEALERHEGPTARPNVKDPWPAVAVGPGVVVVCSVGIDLDLVPFAADARLAAGDPSARLVLVVPERDDHPVTRALASALRVPAEVVAVAGEWRRAATAGHPPRASS